MRKENYTKRVPRLLKLRMINYNEYASTGSKAHGLELMLTWKNEWLIKKNLVN